MDRHSSSEFSCVQNSDRHAYSSSPHEQVGPGYHSQDVAAGSLSLAQGEQCGTDKGGCRRMQQGTADPTVQVKYQYRWWCIWLFFGFCESQAFCTSNHSGPLPVPRSINDRRLGSHTPLAGSDNDVLLSHFHAIPVAISTGNHQQAASSIVSY